MKNYLLILLSFISMNNYSQILNERKLNKIESFGINLTNFNQNEQKVINDWNLILDKDWKRKKTKTAGIVFTSLSILSTAFGAKLISDNKNSEEGVGHSIGVMFVTGGVISAGISVPLFISSSKRKKERDKLIKLYKE
ncbi:hypothetical protein R3X25_11545 [Lutibacter sp. TH_r2]|uniref:hypothetical protein n=1 Tax=Lutibacter sp. TH_r2 TaxID=3082083 RepID=UPI002955DE8A|nr:hypothetical protein [Lutibacter sp. TH_r2]MDV7187916.1 hypothetical protein [Lutibacter sp. TH_r2]